MTVYPQLMDIFQMLETVLTSEQYAHQFGAVIDKFYVANIIKKNNDNEMDLILVYDFVS